jgi:hypothetical protein
MCSGRDGTCLIDEVRSWVQLHEQGCNVSDTEEISGRLLPETERMAMEAPSPRPEGCKAHALLWDAIA